MSDSGLFNFSASAPSSSSSSPLPVSGSFSPGCHCQHSAIKAKRGKNRSKRCSSEPESTVNTSNAIPISSISNPKPLSTMPVPASSLSSPSVSSTPSSFLLVTTEGIRPSQEGWPFTSTAFSSQHQTTPEVENGNSKSQSYSHLQLTVISKILKGIPQNPHFLQFISYSELVRKNLISGWDRIFEETVEEIHALRAGDFWVRARELWKTLEELQSSGYNVLLLRKRLVELSDVMMELKSSKRKILGLKNKAENHRIEKSRVESKILNLQAKVEREQSSMEEALKQAAKIENDLPKFNGVFANLAMKPL